MHKKKSMKILSIQGSPRPNGNSAAIAKRFCDTAKNHGADIECFILNAMHYKGCQGCMACKTKQECCVIKDDVTAVLQQVQTADVLVLSSPVYWGDLSSQMKGFIDRMYSFLKPDYMTAQCKSRLKTGKKLVLVLCQEDPPEEHADIFPRYAFFFDWLGFSESHLIRACSVHSIGAVHKRRDILAEAEHTAAGLFKNGRIRK